MAEKVVIEVEARFKDNVTGKTKSAEKSLKGVEKSADAAQKKLDQLGKNTKKVVVDGSTDKLIKKMDSLEKKTNNLGKTNVAIKLSAKDQATAVINKITSTAKAFANKTYQGILKVKDSGALSTINKVTSAGKTFAGKTFESMVKIKDYATAPLTKIKNTLFSIKSLVLAIGAGMAANSFIVNPIQTADAYSGAQIGFSTLLGDSAGQQMMDDLDQFAKETPFGPSEVIANTQKMLAMGWDAENIIEDMETIGDAAAATGKGTQGLEQIVLALAQIKTKGKVSTEELNQLAEAGLSAKRYLAEGLGYGGDDEGLMKLSKDLENGAIYSDAGLKAILEGMKEYEGMMKTTANETVGGLISQLQDAYEISVKRRWGQGLQDGMKKAFGSVVDLTETAEDGLTKIGDLLYETGSKASNFFADKFKNAVERVNEITGSFEWANAKSIGEKFNMLWKGVISDPLSEWWDDHQAEFAEKAGEIGGKMGKMLSDGIKGILGIADVFDDTELSESGGASIAQSFAKGFVDNFDVSGIGAKFVDAITSIWGALPTWAKILVGGYGAAKLGGAISSIGGGLATLAGGAATARGFIGSAGTNMVAGSGLLGGAANIGYALTGGAAASTLSGGMAALLGGGTVLGGVAAGASTIKGITDLISAYNTDDKTESKARSVSGGVTLGGVATGAATGAAIGSIIPGLGTLVGGIIGAGVGGVAGWLGGDKLAGNIRSAKVESEDLKKAIKDSNTSAEELGETFDKAVFENMKKNLGDIKLTTSEISRIADQIVWGDAQSAYDTFTQAQKSVESAVKSLNEYGAATDKWMWKASLGVQFNDDEIEAIVEQFDGYIQSAKSLVENKHYEFTAAVSMLLDPESAEGKSIIEGGDAFYSKIQEQLDTLSNDLSGKLDLALKDGIITLDEQKELANLQQQIAEITSMLAESEMSAQTDLIKLKFGGGSIDYESFNALMEQMQATIDERMQSSDDAFVASVSGLKIQLKQGAITQDEYDKQVEQLTQGYTATLENMKAEVMGVELDIISGSDYGTMIGGDAKAKLQSAVEEALKTNVDPIEWSPDEVREILGADNLSEEAAAALGQMMSDVFNQVDDLTVETKVNVDPQIEALKQVDPKELAEKLGIPEEQAVTVLEKITGVKDIQNSIQILMEDFGLDGDEAWDIIVKLTGIDKYMNTITPTKEDFGISGTIYDTIDIVLTGNPIFGGTSVVSNDYAGNKLKTGLPGFASGGMIDSSGPRLAMVGEEGPEMIIPLSSQRRGRALKLWTQAGHLMDVPGFARGGMTNGNKDEGIRFSNNTSTASAPTSAKVDVGGISVQINVDAQGGQNVAEAIKAQGADIAETVAGILAEALEAQFANTPTLGGA